jgi:hypothetical protein
MWRGSSCVNAPDMAERTHVADTPPRTISYRAASCLRDAAFFLCSTTTLVCKRVQDTIGQVEYLPRVLLQFENRRLQRLYQ